MGVDGPLGSFVMTRIAYGSHELPALSVDRTFSDSDSFVSLSPIEGDTHHDGLSFSHPLEYKYPPNIGLPI